MIWKYEWSKQQLNLQISKFSNLQINNMLSIKNLHAGIEGKDILKVIDLEVKAG